MYEVYLAGRISGLNFKEANEDRLRIAKKLENIGIKCRNPLRGKSWLKSSDVINKETVEKELTLQEVILRDLHDIDRVNVILILTGDNPSWGTSGEFWYATWVANKPTLVVANNYMGGWLDYYATKIVPNMDVAVEVLSYWKDYWDDGKKVNE